MTELNFSKYIFGEGETSQSAALLILNQGIPSLEFLKRLWGNVRVRMCADGGANRLYDVCGVHSERERHLPHLIRGDLDSLREDVGDFYRSHNVLVEKMSDQDTTDFQKCMFWLRSYESEHQIPPLDLIVLGAFGGRLDQTLSNLHTMYCMDPRRRVFLTDFVSVATLLRSTAEGLEENQTGESISSSQRSSHHPSSQPFGVPLTAPSSPPSSSQGSGSSADSETFKQGKPHRISCLGGFEGPACGIVPLGTSQALVKTQGLKWNLDSHLPLAFGKLVSTSNTFDETATTQDGDKKYHVVHVWTNRPVLWTCQVQV